MLGEVVMYVKAASQKLDAVFRAALESAAGEIESFVKTTMCGSSSDLRIRFAMLQYCFPSKSPLAVRRAGFMELESDVKLDGKGFVADVNVFPVVGLDSSVKRKVELMERVRSEAEIQSSQQAGGSQWLRFLGR